MLKLLAPRWNRLAPIDNRHEKSDALYEYLYHVNVQSPRYVNDQIVFFR